MSDNFKYFLKGLKHNWVFIALPLYFVIMAMLPDYWGLIITTLFCTLGIALGIVLICIKDGKEKD